EGGDAGFPEERLRDLRALADRLRAAAKALDDRGFSPALLDRQRRLLQDTGVAVGDALVCQRYAAAGRTSFARRMAPLVLANATDAARAQIDGYHAQLAKWRQQLSAEDWQKLRVVVSGSQMPRKGHLAVQYFAHLLGEKGEGPRIVYAEAIFDEKRALNL